MGLKQQAAPFRHQSLSRAGAGLRRRHRFKAAPSPPDSLTTRVNLRDSTANRIHRNGRLPYMQ